MLNQCFISGNLGADPEIHYPNSGETVASFSLAFKSGKDKTGWIKITCFKKLAEAVEKYLHKGARIIVVGSLNQEKWETDNGEKRTGYKIIAHTIEFIKTDGRGFKEGETKDDLPF